MCRLFGLHARATPVPATFWLIDAPDSLEAQSHRNPDGAGIGAFGRNARPVVSRQPLAAWDDPAFASAAHNLVGTTFVAHVRHASTGGHTIGNTHPFLQDGRLFAHNGVVEGLPELDARLSSLGATGLVHGETDSERVFALISAEASHRGGDVGEGIVAAIGWIAAHLPVYALNLVLVTATDLWALRYPATHELYVLARPAGGADGHGDLDAQSDRIHARSGELANLASLVVASERMDGEPGWRLLDAGELLYVDAALTVDSSRPFPPPAHLLGLAELDARAAASQHPKGGTTG